MQNQNTTSKPDPAEEPTDEGLDGTTCSLSLGELPTPHPSGAWDRTDYVREYAKRAEEIATLKKELKAAGDRIYVMGRTQSDYIAAEHYRQMSQSSENAKAMTRPGQDSTNTTDDL